MTDQVDRGLAAPAPEVIGGIYSPDDDLPFEAPDGYRLIDPDAAVDAKEYMIFAYAVWRKATRYPGYIDRTAYSRWYTNAGTIFYCAHCKIKAIAEEDDRG